MGCGCKNKLKSLSAALAGTDGVGISSITSEAATVGGEDGTNITFNMTDGSTQGPFFIVDGVDGTDGTDGVSVDDIQLTDGSTASGQTATYTMYDVEDNIIGTFQVYNGSDGGVTIANVGSGADVFQEGSSSPFNYRSLTSSDGSVDLTQSTTEIDIKTASATWIDIESSGYGSSDAPKFNVPSGFSTFGNVNGFPTVQMYLDSKTGLVFMKGTAGFSGAANYLADPTGSASELPFTIITQIQAAYQPANAVEFPVTLRTPSNSIGTGVVRISGSTATLYVDNRLTTVNGTTQVHFEGTFYTTEE